MDKRLFLALGLSALVIVLTQIIFPAPRRQPSRTVSTSADSTLSARADSPDSATPALGGRVPESTTGGAASADTGASAATLTIPPETVSVMTPRVAYGFSTAGAVPVSAVLRQYEALSQPGSKVELARPGLPLLSFALVNGSDTVQLDRTTFAVDTSARGNSGSSDIAFRANAGRANVLIAYSFGSDGYMAGVTGTVTGLDPARRALLITLPGGLRSQEADSVDNNNQLALAYKAVGKEVESVPFAKLDTGERLAVKGPLNWVATRNKYFLVAVLSDTAASPFPGATFASGHRPVKKQATNANATLTQPISPDGRFAFNVYMGPQEWRRLRSLGRDLVYVNPSGGIFRAIVQPFSTLIMSALLWMHDRLSLSYGWVLVVFGIVVRLILWPLNQSAMRSNLKMQRLQPEMQEIQKKYKSDPEKQQAAMMRLYKEHNMSPLSMFSGCLPMLLPMPVLFALFFVFQNTIEFRGVSFLWLADISQKDPYYIIPVLMGVSMFLLSWIGMRGVPPNPQAKMMGYALPVVMTVFFLNLASGLNLYYAVQNIAALPQQWLIANERRKGSAKAK